MEKNRSASSFRDPSGFVFHQDGAVYRQINAGYRKEYDMLMGSGLYKALTDSKLLIPHEEAGIPGDEGAYKVIKPRRVDFISYPYEWCFSQLKDAALATLAVEKTAIGYGMSLKDASAYNIQFVDGRPMLIDTLSFEAYVPGRPWRAYKQFCQHFLAPLALMGRTDVRLGQLLRTHLDGIPLDLASKLLPARTHLSRGLLMHLHLHSKGQAHFSENKTGKDVNLGKNYLPGLIDSLESAVKGLSWTPQKTVWEGYYRKECNYAEGSLDSKKTIVEEFLAQAKPAGVWDMGANVGLMTRSAAALRIPSIAFEMDPSCVEENYLSLKASGEANILPLVMDLTNPSPSLGWSQRERMGLIERGPADTVLALALIHHLALGNNVPLQSLASFFSEICGKLIIEFVPKTDSNAKRLLYMRENLFDSYDEANFEAEFGRHFRILSKKPVAGTERTLYLMVKR